MLASGRFCDGAFEGEHDTNDAPVASKGKRCVEVRSVNEGYLELKVAVLRGELPRSGPSRRLTIPIRTVGRIRTCCTIACNDSSFKSAMMGFQGRSAGKVLS